MVEWAGLGWARRGEIVLTNYLQYAPVFPWSGRAGGEERLDKKTSLPSGGFNVTEMTNDLPGLQQTVRS